ncbi:hypothetical protein AVEN_649-1 [Araneus ventricosus]|uniref:Uncharacterized protein n=1 Tax=Araneus ventricosus TaxID=182803 RepID=A0A4Y2BVT7_ARAVE|nr:hypothetical protein AVEN_649-1 [Araneus ventricosus]
MGEDPPSTFNLFLQVDFLLLERKEIFDIGVLCVIAVLLDKLESAKNKIELDEPKDESTELLMPNYVRFAENFSSEIDNSFDAGVFEEHSTGVATSEIIQTEETAPKLISFSNETLFSEETAAPSTSEGNRDNKSGNKDEFLIALLDELDKWISHQKWQTNYPKTQFWKQQNDNEKAFGTENITVEATAIAQTAKNEADCEKSPTFLDEKCSLQNARILKKYDEKTTECQILTAEAVVNHIAAENIAAEEISTTLLHEQCYLMIIDVPVPEKYDEKTSEYQILPVEAIVNILVGDKSSTFFDGKCSLQGVPLLEVYNETNFECEILTEEPAVNGPSVDVKANDEKLSPFLDEYCSLQYEPVPGKYDEKLLKIKFFLLKHLLILPLQKTK